MSNFCRRRSRIQGAANLLRLVGVIVRDPVRLVHDAFDRKKKWDDVVDDLGRWCADFNATFRDLRKIYEFRVKDRDPLHFQMLDDGRKKRKRPRK